MGRLDTPPPSRKTTPEPLSPRVDVVKDLVEKPKPRRKPTRYTVKFYEILKIEDAHLFDKALDRIELGWPRLSFLKDENFWENPTSDAESFQNFVKIIFNDKKGRMYKALAVIDAFIANYPKFLTDSGDLADSLNAKRSLILSRIAEYEGEYIDWEPYVKPVVLKKADPLKGEGAKKPLVAASPATSKNPKFGDAKFYEMYKITDVDEFNTILKPLNIWIEDTKWQELNSPDFWNSLGVEASDKRKSTVRRFFYGKSGAITSLVSAFDTFSDTYPDFFADMDNPDSNKYRELFDLVMQRLFEYYKVEKFDSAAIDNHVLDTMLAYVENLDLDKAYRKKILEKMISYVSEMKIFDTGRLAMWEGLESEYIKKLKEFK